MHSNSNNSNDNNNYNDFNNHDNMWRKYICIIVPDLKYII